MEEFDNIIDVADNSDWTPVESMIKVIGVGGGGCNAVNYMFRENVKGCSFIVCNTDRQALESSPVPVKIHLGKSALGAGTDPEKGRKAALETQDLIEKVALDESTKMLFITAGMGGGTGTGASPVIARMAKDKGILTVAVVTIPFATGGGNNKEMARAIDGIHDLIKNVDSLLIINNEKLCDYYGNMLIHEAFPKADEVLATAVRGITEIISRPGYINVDFEDVKTMMTNSGMALMGCGFGSGEDRIDKALKDALNSPLLSDFDITTAKSLLVNITCVKNKNGLKMDDLKKINEKIAELTNHVQTFKTGLVYLDDDPEIKDKIQITAIATGFKADDLQKIARSDLGNYIHIGKDFKYENPLLLEEDEDSEYPCGNTTRIIGPASGGRTRKFSFSSKPALAVEPGEDLAELENVPAIRRAEHTSEPQE
jgi:cell division protein FtsZ